ncbi:hypothetical protein P0Y35_04765 [Kiritimatiellaeota bacterium B1221]|nr:hypothetical protein [Kiritimatiellaeota bacterium B1221]
MKRFPLTLLLLSILFSGFLRATDFSSYLPDNITLLIESRAIPEQKELWEKTPFYLSLQEVNWEIIMRTLDSGDEEFDADEVIQIFTEIQNTWNALQSQLDDAFVFAIGDLNKIIESSQAFDDETEEVTEEEDPELFAIQEQQGLDFLQVIMGTFYTMADVKDMDAVDTLLSESVERLIQTDEDELFAKYDQDEIRGLEFMEDEKSMGLGLYWALEQNILILGYTTDAVQRQRDWIQSPPVNALDRKEDYLHTRENALEDYHVLSYIPVGTILNQIAAFFNESDEVEDLEMIKKIWDWVDPSAMLPMSYSFRLGENRMSARTMAGFKHECGLQKLFLSPRGKSAPKPSFTHKNFGSISTIAWSLPRFYAALEAELPKISPQASAALGMGRMMASGQLGFDFKLQLLDHLGDGFVAFQTIDPKVVDQVLEAENQEDPEALLQLLEQHPTQGQYTLMGIELKNTDAIQRTVNILIGKIHPQGAPEPESYRGVNLYYPIPEGGVGAAQKTLVSYAYLDNYLLIAMGDPNLLHMAVDAHQDPALQIWGQDEYTQLRDQFPFEAQGQDFSSGQMLNAVMSMVKKQFIAGFLSGTSMESAEATRSTITRELNKITFGIGASFSLNQMGELEMQADMIQEYAH